MIQCKNMKRALYPGQTLYRNLNEGDNASDKELAGLIEAEFDYENVRLMIMTCIPFENNVVHAPWI